MRLNQRRGIILILLSCFIAGLFILLYRGPGWLYLRGYGGDVVVMVFIYFLVRLVIKLRSKSTTWKIALLTFLFACLIETNQLWWSAFTSHSALATIVAGTTFDWLDLFAYALGTLLAVGLDMLCSRYVPVR